MVSKLECPDPEIWKRYMKRFAKTIVKVLIAYADIVKKEFPSQLKEERIVSILKRCTFIYISPRHRCLYMFAGCSYYFVK